MDDEASYSDKLRASNALRSLALEHAIHRTISTYKSADRRYPFYFNDPNENKTRELDLFAEFHFKSGIQEGTASIEFLIECKDLKGSHLIFSRVKPRWPHSEGASDHTFTERQDDFLVELLEEFGAMQTDYHVDRLREVDHVRLRLDVLGESEFWVDVIQHSQFEVCFRKIFDHYWMHFPTELYCELDEKPLD